MPLKLIKHPGNKKTSQISTICRDERLIPRCHPTSWNNKKLFHALIIFRYFTISYPLITEESELPYSPTVNQLDFSQPPHRPIQSPALQPLSHHQRLSVCCLVLTTPDHWFYSIFNCQISLLVINYFNQFYNFQLLKEKD